MIKKLDRSLVSNISKYNDPTFKLLFNYLMAANFKFDDRIQNVNEIIPTYFKLIWRSSVLVGNLTGPKKKVDPQDLMHSGMHHLLAERFSRKLEKMPHFTLLSEALASSLDVFLGLEYFKRDGIKHPSVKIGLSGIRTDKKAAMKLFNRSLDNPFETYKKVAQLSFDVNIALYDSALKQKKSGIDPDGLVKKVFRKNELLPYIGYLDHSTFVFYTMALCGRKSSQNDRKCVSDCLTVLQNANSMEEFLTDLGA